MNDLQSSLFETMKQFSDYTKASSDAATTFQGTIKEVEDAGAGKYLVEYLGNNVKCSSPNGISYLVGDNVYVLVPNGDFTKDKIILGLIDPREKKNYVQENADTIYYEISNNFIDNQAIPELIEMNSYHSEKSDAIDITTYTSVTPKLINDFLKNGHKIFAFSFLAKTNLPQEQRSSGNYGVTLSLPLKVKSADGGGAFRQEQKNFTIDVSNMHGDPYHLETWTPQTLYFTIDDQYEIAETKVNPLTDPEPRMTISYFCSDFIQGEKPEDYKDIRIKSLGFYAVDALSISESESLSLVIKATEGIYFTSNSAVSKTLTSYLRINGKNTEISKSSEIYWFVEDISVKADSPYYCSQGGLGWKCLNEKTHVTKNEDGTETFDWVTTNKSITVNKSNVFTSTKYKCVVIYNSNKINKIITIQNLDSDHEIKLESNSPDNVFVKNTGYAHLIAKVRIDDVTNSEDNRDSIFCSWVRYDKNGTMMTGEEETKALEVIKTNEIVSEVIETDPGVFVTIYYYATEVRFPLYLIDEFSTFYCSVTYLHNDEHGVLVEDHVGTESILISTSEAFEYKVVIDNDNIIYKYDVHGTSPTLTRNYDGPDSSKVTSIAPLTYRVYKADGEELTKEEYCYVHYKWLMPKNSLFRPKSGYEYYEDDNYYYTEDYDNYQHSVSFYYDIKNKFDLRYSKNPIILELEINGSKLRQTVDINFIKEGGNGSNGTIYSAIITFNDMPYGAINSNGITEKLKFVYNISTKKLYRHNYNNNTLVEWTGGNREALGLKVYRDSDLLSADDYTVTWGMFDASTTTPCFQINNAGLLTLKDGISITLNNDYCNIVRATVTVNESNGNYSLANRKQMIYVYYPIEITLMSQINSSGVTIIPSMDGGFGEVIYRSDGTDPQYDSSSKLFTINDNSILDSELLEFKDYFTISWDSQHHLTRKNISSTEVEITADNKYDNGNTKNYVKATLTFDGTKEADLRTLRGNQADLIEEFNDKKDILEANQSMLENFGNVFYIRQWMAQIENSINILLNCTTRVKQSLETLNDRVEEFKKFMISDQYSYSPEITLRSFYTTSGLEGKVGSLFNDVYAALDKVVKLNNINDLDNLITIINNIYFVDRIEWQGDWTRTIRDNIGGPTLANTAMAYAGQVDAQINDCYTCIGNVKNIIREQLIQGAYQVIKDQYDSALGELTSSDARYVKLKANLTYYYRSFDTITSIREFRELLKRAYDCTSNIFYINNSGSLSLKQDILDEYTRNIAECDRIINSATTNIKDIDRILNVVGYTIKHLRPIILHFSTNEMSNINGWDGNKIQIGEDYLLALQVGAGRKDSFNRFTGVTIGQRNIKSGSTYEAQLGLFGYYQDKQSIFLNAEDGSATFGISGDGQIIIQPGMGKAIIKSGNYIPKDASHAGSGMQIDLSTPEIRFGSENFIVSSAGILTAKGAIIDGKIIAGKVGDWVVENGEIKSKSNSADCVELIADTSTIKLGTDRNYGGKIYSGSHSTLDSVDQGFYLSHDGLSIHNSFKITSNNGQATLELGNLSGPHWMIEGTGSGGRSYISYNCSANIFHPAGSSSSANSQEVYIGTDGINLGKKFSVDNEGNLIANNVDLTGKITTTSGKIANFIIGSHDLRSGSIPGVHRISTVDKDGGVVEDSEDVGYGNGISSTLDHDSIMLWCGANDSHIGTAPFRIYADGNAVINRWIMKGDTYLDTVLYTADYTGGAASLRSGVGLSGGSEHRIKDWRGQSGNTKYIAAWFGEDSRSIANAPILLFHSGEAKIANMIFDNRGILSADDAANHWRIEEDANGISTLNIDNVSSKDNGQTWNLYIDSNGESHLRVHHVDIIT